MGTRIEGARLMDQRIVANNLEKAGMNSISIAKILQCGPPQITRLLGRKSNPEQEIHILLDMSISGKDAAVMLGVTPSAVCQRRKKLKAGVVVEAQTRLVALSELAEEVSFTASVVDSLEESVEKETVVRETIEFLIGVLKYGKLVMDELIGKNIK
jgi:predicted transcriptional regulator